MSDNKLTLNAGSRQIWLRVGAPILVLVLAIVAGALAISWSLAERLDRDWIKDTQRLVSGAVAGEAHALATTTTDFALWSDAYRATSLHWDQKWVVRNFFSATADGLLVFQGDGQVRYAWYSDLNKIEVGADANLVRQAGSPMELRRIAVETAASRMSLNTFAVSRGDLVLIATAPISWETQKERAQGRPNIPVDYIALIDRIDAAEWKNIGQKLGLEGLTFRQGLLTAQQVDDLVWSPVYDQTGNVLGGLTWRDERPGTTRFAAEFWPIALSVLLAGLCTIWLARSLVSRQLRLLAQAQATLQASRLKSEFIATMSHELRTPLNTIIGYSELIREQADEDTPKDQEAREDAERINAAAKHLLRLINEVLDHASIDSGSTPLALEEIDVSLILTEAMEVVEPLAQARSNSLSVSNRTDGLHVVADHARLSQCLLHLLGNAVKFTKDGAVEISVRRSTLDGKSVVAIDVTDTGVGIDKAVLQTLFTPFSQADGSATRAYQGAGLGLSTARRLARAMGGDVTAISTLGKGSTFSLMIPAAEQVQRAA